MEDNWKEVATMLTHFMLVADLGITPEEHGTRNCLICKEARLAYVHAMAAFYE